MGVHPARSPLLDHLERHRSPSIRSAAIADVVGRNIFQRRQGGSPAGCSNTADPAAAFCVASGLPRSGGSGVRDAAHLLAIRNSASSSTCIRPCSRSRCTAARCSHPLTAG